MRVVIDHLAGSRRGQRQEFAASARIRFGRHPECEVSFDPHKDIDASSRHAELRSVEPAEASAGPLVAPRPASEPRSATAPAGATLDGAVEPPGPEIPTGQAATSDLTTSAPAPRGWVLVDLGSSNGTYVDGRRVTETPVVSNVPVAVQFGPGGPRIRLFVGDADVAAALPPAPLPPERPRWPLVVAGVVVAVVALGLGFAAC